jgi:L-2-hydroxyglutarate oxidase LhgO
LNSVDVLVVGAGVIGLAIAREFAMAGKEVVILEAERHYGTGTSSRNSGVIHAGIYYPTDSKKAQWCVRGRHLLYEYARARHIDHKPIGKVIVARQAEATRLEALYATGRSNGIDDLELISGQEAQRLEPALGCDLAMYSPSTGIIDAHALMHALLADAQAHGAVIAVESRFQSAQHVGGRWHCEVLGETITSEILINSAGLDAIAVARRIVGIRPELIPEMFFAKGNYARLMGRCPFTRLIYPVPVPGGLGTHLTIDLGGQASFGPDVEWVPSPTPEQAGKGLVGHFSYQVDESRLTRFEADVRTWWPGLPDCALAPGYAGVRPKLVGPNQPAADYLVQGPREHGLEGLVNLMGMESPGLTSCLAIAQAVREIV